MSERLIDFLYILARDHLPMGVLEGIMWDQVDTEKSSYCNHYLESYVRDFAERLTDEARPIVDWKYMHLSDADGTEQRYWIEEDGTRTPAPRKQRKVGEAT